MNKNKKFNRIVITIAIMTLLGTSNAIVLPPTVSADSSNEINDIIKQCSKPITGMHVPADLHESLRCIYLNPKVYEKPGKELVGEQINIKDFTIDSVNLFLKKKPEYIVKAKGDPQHNETENLFFGINQLVNDTNQDQTLSTSTFSKAVTNSVTSGTTHAFKVGSKATAKFQVPLIAEAGVELSAEYNFSNIENNTQSETITYSVPQQNIKVPANTTARVTTHLKTSETTGKVELATKYKGKIEFMVTPIGFKPTILKVS